MEQIRPKTVRLFMLQKYMQRDSNIMFCSSKQFLEFRILKKKRKKKNKDRTATEWNRNQTVSLKVQYNCGARVPHTVAQPSLCVLLTPQLQSPRGELGFCAFFVVPTVLSH